jgi:hypothetical protein
VKELDSHSQRAQTHARAAHEPTRLSQRLTYSHKEFAEANGKSATWAYRQIYASKIKVISDCGRLRIPRSEVDHFLARAAEYNPQPKPKQNAASKRQGVTECYSEGERPILNTDQKEARAS